MIRFKVLLFICLFVMVAKAQSPVKMGVAFSTYFEDKTMRVDYLHSGTSQTESFTLYGIKNEGPWGGRVSVLNDPYQLGLYAFDIVDVASGKVIYTQGFCSVFGEWQTTLESRELNKSFQESVRFPWPKNTFKLVMRKRDSTQVFQEIWAETINPAQYAESQWTYPEVKVRYFLNSGNPKHKVDIVVLADGFTLSDTLEFSKDVNRFMDAFFSVEPFKSRKADFNVAAVYSLSPAEGIRLQKKNFYPSNILGCSYSTFGIDRYVLSDKEWTVRDYAAVVPYDFIVILMNSNKYGGGGIYNLYITASARIPNADYVMVHEMGHHIAGLADEYYTSEVAYQVSVPHYEPWEFNITALLDPTKLKWKEMVEPGTPIPTPWNKQDYEKTMKLNISKEPFQGKVGAFEGAGYLSQGMYRPEVNCIMFSHSLTFCRVCQDGLNKVLDIYVAK